MVEIMMNKKSLVLNTIVWYALSHYNGKGNKEYVLVLDVSKHVLFVCSRKLITQVSMAGEIAANSSIEGWIWLFTDE